MPPMFMDTPLILKKANHETQKCFGYTYSMSRDCQGRSMTDIYGGMF